MRWHYFPMKNFVTSYICQKALYCCLWRHFHIPLQWRHNDHDGVSNHQPDGCLLNRLFRRRSKKTSKLRVTGLCAGNSPVTGEFPAQRASNAENVSIWWRHRAFWPYGKTQEWTESGSNQGNFKANSVSASKSRPVVDKPKYFSTGPQPKHLHLTHVYCVKISGLISSRKWRSLNHRWGGRKLSRVIAVVYGDITLRPRQNGRYFPHKIFKCISLNENVSILNTIWLKFVPTGPINNDTALVQIIAWRRSGAKP